MSVYHKEKIIILTYDFHFNFLQNIEFVSVLVLIMKKKPGYFLLVT